MKSYCSPPNTVIGIETANSGLVGITIRLLQPS